MSELETTQGGKKWADEDEDCPLCLEALPPFWDAGRRSKFICCNKTTCKKCNDKRDAYLDRALADGSFGREEEQLASYCPLCRAEIPTGDTAMRTMLDRYEKGQLPLHMYCDLGARFIDGQEGVGMNVERGIEIWKLGAERGDPNCQYMIGFAHGVQESTTEAKRWYLAAAEQGHAIAEYNLASMFRDEGNDAEAMRHLRGSVSKGYDRACSNLGQSYYNGEHGLKKSSEEAIRVLTPAAERGHADSMCLLGDIMCCPEPNLMGPGNANFVKGLHWLRRAAEKGDQTHTTNLKSVEDAASRICFKCNEDAPPGRTFLRCSKCRAAWYCSKDCQVQHWKAEEGGHKQICIKWESE